MTRFLSVLVLLLILDTSGKGLERPAGPFLVIVHPSNEEPSLTKSGLSRLFLKKHTRWSDGRPVVPMDLADGSPTRSSFSRAIHGRQLAAINSYWQQQIFSGRGIPPREVDSEEEVVRLVAQTPGAVAYVSTSTPLAGVRVVRIVE